MVMAGCLLAASAAAQTLPKELVKASILADMGSIEPGKAFNVGVMLKIIPDWHVYWRNAGDAGIPTTVSLKLPDGFTAGPLQYPTPRRFEQTGGIIMFGYADEVMLVATVTPPAKIDAPQVHIAADVNYLVCEKTCVPGDAKLSLDLPVSSAKPSNAELFKSWAERMPAGHSPLVKSVATTIASTSEQPNKTAATIVVKWKDAPPANLEWFPPASEALMFSNIKVEPAADGSTKITTVVERLPGLKIGAALESVVAGGDGAHRVGIAVPIDVGSIGWKD
jgi:DsbC/DsbD-like thiol-disulfide interchange protein